ncbi:MAG TPA: SusC/RagA family TonB-linked outer membrane protein [Prolixibacteraceae bacterium]|nr:SusC/RagA family TonB-linked outer membrane protein [Prolixibacteraceae bacterium]
MKKKFVNDSGGISMSLLKKNLLKMKLTILCLLLGLVQLMANEGFSQSTRLTLNLKETKVEDVLMKIEEQSNLYFIYNRDVVDVNRIVNISCTNQAVAKVLTDLFAGTDVDYEIQYHHIILKSSLEPISQPKSISGKVTDFSGATLPGVSVVVKGTTKGIITDGNGTYSLSNIPETSILQFSFVGMKTQEVAVSGKSTIDVIMQEEAVGIDEVVAVGYGTTSRKNLTTAISKVKTDEITKAASSNMTQLMMGRAGGLQATVTSAQPGGNVNISIRGAAEPIYIVDGVMMPSSSLEGGSGGSVTVTPSAVNRSGLAGLNPEDIESVEILKDASASIYGIGAANGVILITTKKGKEGALKVSYDGSQSVVMNYKYLDILNAQQYMGLVNVFNKEQYLYINNMAPFGTSAYNNGWTAPFSDSQIASAQTTDWKNDVLRNGSIANHNIAVNGGSKLANYYVSGNYFNQSGSVSNSNMERYALRSNISFQLNPFIKLTSAINVNRNSYNNSTVGGTANGRGEQAMGALAAALTYPSNLPIKDENGNYTLFMNVPNPVAMEDILDKTATNGTYLNFSADFDLIKNMLAAKLLYGNNLENSRRTTFIPSYVYFDNMYKSRGNLGTDNRMNQTMEATLSFKKSFNDFLNMDAVVGMGKYKNNYDGMNVAYDGQHDAIQNDNLSSVTGVVSPGSYRSANEKRSQFIRANFDFLDRYVIAFTLRRDGTDKFFPDKKYAFFPSVSSAWKVSNESFLKGVSWLNLLKVRASYGETGSDNLGTSLYGTYGPFGNQIMFDNNTIKYIPIVTNGIDYPNVSWQKTTMKNIGIDFSILKDKVWGSFDVFQNDITDMLGSANTAGLSMFGTYPINGAHLQRKGWDATVNSKNLQTEDFLWTTILTLSRYNSLWIERMPNYDYNAYEIQGKVASNARYFYQTSGIINADMSNMPSSQPAAAQKPGYPIIVDQNNDGEITIDDIKMSNEVPKLYFGFGNTFNYKKFDLDIFLYSQLGVNKYNYARDWASSIKLANSISNSNSFAFDMWNSQTNPNGTQPGIAWDLASVTLPGSAGTDIGYQNASFVRVRNITLGYNISGRILGAIGQYVSNIRIYIDAQNPLTFTKFEGFDPEVYTGGGYKGGKAEYPQTRTFSAGVKITL